MRKAALLGHSLAFCVALACMPQQELSAYSEGAEASGAPALAPAALPGEPAALPGEPAEPLPGREAEASAEPSDTPVDTDGPAQPEQLAPTVPAASAGSMDADAAPAGAAPADGSEPPADGSEPPAEPAAPAPPAAATDPSMSPTEPAPVPLVGDVAPVTAQFRFIRLVADSAFNGGPLSSAAELDVFGAEGQVLDRTGWAATADSAEPTIFGGQPASLAIDGSPASVWHTAWFQLPAPPAHPHFLQVDLGQPRSVTGFRYLARQDVSVGRVAAYRFFVSTDGVQWGEPILAGTLQDSALPQDVRLASP